MKKFRTQLKKFLRQMVFRNWGLKIFSLILALLLWSFAVSVASPQEERWVYQVPVSYVGEQTLLQNGLKIDENFHPTVMVRILTDRGQAAITPQDIRVKADVAHINQQGMVTVALTATSPKGYVIAIYPQQMALPIVAK